MPENLVRFTVSMPEELVERFDSASAARGYASRSAAVRDALQEDLVRRLWDEGDADEDVVATLTIVCRRGRVRERPASVPGCRELLETSSPLSDERELVIVALQGRRQAVTTLSDLWMRQPWVEHAALTRTALPPRPGSG